MAVFICTRQVECLFEIEAPNLQAALAQLPSTADSAVETAHAVSFGTSWEVQLDTQGVSRPQSFDCSDVAEAKAAGVMLPSEM